METEQTQDHLLNNKLYDFLKLLALIVLPAIGTLYVALAAIWGLPDPEQVSATIVAIVTFLGVLIKLGDVSYNKSTDKYAGTINVVETPDKKLFSLDLNSTPESIEAKKEVTFKVAPPV